MESARPSHTHRRPRTRTGAGPAAAPLFLAGAAVLAVATGAGVHSSAGADVADDAEPAVLVLDAATRPAAPAARADRAAVRKPLAVRSPAQDAAARRAAAVEAASERAARNAAVRAAAVRKAAAQARKLAAEERATTAAIARATAPAKARLAAADRARRAAEAEAARVIEATARAQALAAAGAADLGDVVAPVVGYTLSAGFGEPGAMWKHDHTGLDFACPAGTFVRAVADGTVVSAGWAGAYGWRTVVRHADGTETWYAHQFAQVVRSGKVTAGQVIGVVGSTGNSTGPHLHLEVRVGGVPVDPAAWLAARGVAV